MPDNILRFRALQDSMPSAVRLSSEHEGPGRPGSVWPMLVRSLRRLRREPEPAHVECTSIPGTVQGARNRGAGLAAIARSEHCFGPCCTAVSVNRTHEHPAVRRSHTWTAGGVHMRQDKRIVFATGLDLWAHTTQPQGTLWSDSVGCKSRFSHGKS